MTVQIESLFTAALGLQAPWAVESLDLDNARHRIDFPHGLAEASMGQERMLLQCLS